MILYFTGTGNSEYAAKRIANGISDFIMTCGGSIGNAENHRKGRSRDGQSNRFD